jgi:hypothetical protein
MSSIIEKIRRNSAPIVLGCMLFQVGIYLYVEGRTLFREKKGFEKRALWERNTTKSNDFKCYFIMKQYYEQCSHDYLDESVKLCGDLAEGIRTCKQDLYKKLPRVTPNMLPLPLAFQPRSKI